MLLKKSVLIGALALLPIVAFAHAHLEKSMPADKSKGPAPEHIMLDFSEATQLTALTIQKEGSKDAKKLTLPKKPEKSVHVDAPSLEPGAYVLKWRAVGDDKHVQSGEVHFTVVAK